MTGKRKRRRLRGRGVPGGVPLPALVMFALMISAVCSAAELNLAGSLSTEYRLRATSEDQDNDLYEYLILDAGNPLADKVTFHLYGRAAADLDGEQDNEGFYVFDNIDDTYENAVSGRLYAAYLDVHRVEGLDRLRVGRQVLRETPITLYLDGLLIETEEVKQLLNLKLGAYGGVPVHLYEPEPEGNSLYGAYLQSRPWRGARLALHWTHALNDYLFGEKENDFYAVELWQVVNQFFRCNANYTWLDERPRDWSASATLYYPEWDLVLQGRYYELIETQQAYAMEFDRFFAPLQEYKPFWQASGLIYKGLGDKLALEGGVDGRKLKDEDDESWFNHEFLRYFATVHAGRLKGDGLEGSVSYEAWDSYSRENEIRTVSGDLTYKQGKNRFTLGTDYSLYKYDYYLDSERDNVRTYYARLRWQATDNLRADFRYEYEDDDYDDYHWIKASVTYSFGKER